MADKLARLYWQMGQTLLPEHFSTQEEALLADVEHRFRMTGLPFYGVGRLKWNESLLTEGIVSIQNMSLIFPSGLLLEVPSNAKSNSFNMNVAGTSDISLYIHLLGDKAEVDAASENGEEEGSVPRKVYQLEISSEQNNSDALDTMKLANFHKDPEGVWKLKEDYIPPLLQVSTSPFLKDSLDNLNQTIELFHYKLMQEIAATYLSGENLFNAKQCLQGVYRLQRFLANLNSQVHFHPFYLYEALKTFYTELCLYQNSTPENIASPYNHDQLAECFSEILDPLLGQIQRMKGKSPYLSFEKKEGVYVIQELPATVSRAKEVYFLLQKSRINEQVSLDGLKLASFSRLPVVHQLALHGVPYQKIDSPPFQHPFGAEVDFYILLEGEEWDHVLSESSIAFYHQPGLEDVKAYLYWRQG